MKKYVFAAELCLIVGLCAYMVYAHPICSDDYLYTHCFVAETAGQSASQWHIDLSKKISTLGDVVSSQYYHYLYQNGRAVVHACVQLFVGILGTGSLACFYALLLPLFILLYGKIGLGDRFESHRSFAFLPFGAFLLFQIEPSVMYGSVAGVMNYLYPSVLCLLFWYLLHDRDFSGGIQRCLFLLLAFLAGWSHEGMVLPFSLAILAYCYLHRKEMPVYKWTAVLSWGVGAAFLIFAPGNFIRMGDASLTLYGMLYLGWLIRVFYVLLLAVLIVWVFRRKATLAWLSENRELVFALLVSLPFFMLLKSKPIRTGFGIDLLSSVLLARLLAKTVSVKYLQKSGHIMGLILVTVLSVVTCCNLQVFREMESICRTVEASPESPCHVPVRKSACPAFLRMYLNTYDKPYAKDWMRWVWEVQYGKQIIFDEYEEDHLPE